MKSWLFSQIRLTLQSCLLNQTSIPIAALPFFPKHESHGQYGLGLCFCFSSTTGFTTALYCCIKLSISVLFGSAVTVSTSSSVQYAAPAGCAGSAELEGNSSCAGSRSTSTGSSSTVPSHLVLILEKYIWGLACTIYFSQSLYKTIAIACAFLSSSENSGGGWRCCLFSSSFCSIVFLDCRQTKKRRTKHIFAIEVCISNILATALLNWIKFPVNPTWPPSTLAPPWAGAICILPVHPGWTHYVIWNSCSIADIHGKLMGANWNWNKLEQ